MLGKATSSFAYDVGGSAQRERDFTRAECAEVLFASYPAGTVIPPHRHDTDNHCVIIRGELILTMNGERKRFGVGDWYHVPAHAEHAAEFEVETDEIEFWFHRDKAE